MLKRLSIVLGIVAALAVGVYVEPASTEGAVVINDIGCGLLDGDGNFVVADSSHAVVTPSGNGMLTCKVGDVANSTGRAVRHDFDSTGVTCSTPAGSTEDWFETVSASGNATLVCRVKP